MANSQAITTSFKLEVLSGVHALGVTFSRTITTVDSFKAALYVASATVDATTAAYSATNEVSGTGYTAGGVVITNANVPAAAAGTAYWTPSAGISYTGVTLSNSFDTVLFYNSTIGNRSVAVYTFGAQTITTGNFTLVMPTNDQTTGLLRLT